MLREWRGLVRLALPLVAVNLGQQLMGVVDTALSGRIGALAQAATGLGNTVFFVGALFGIGITLGVDPLTSQAFGAGRSEDARRAMWQGVWASLLLFVPIAALVFSASRSLELVGIEPVLAVETRRYLDARLLSLLPLLLLTVVRSYLQSADRAAPIVWAMVVANLVNLAADWVLVFGDDGLERLGLPALGVPALGVVGLGWATTAATVLNVVWMAISVRRDRRSLEGRSWRRLDRVQLGRVFALGVPIGLHMLAEIGIFSVAGVLAGTMGQVPMAAHQVALQLAALMFMVPMGVGAATSVRVGQAVGRGDRRAMARAGTVGILTGGIFMMASAISMWTIPWSYARLMTSDAAVLPLAASLILIAGAFQLFDGLQVVAAAALRGAGVTRWTMAANFVAYWVVGLPLIHALGFRFGLGPHGLWWGLTAGLALAAALLVGRFAVVARRGVAAL